MEPYKIYLINLNRSPERLARMEREFARCHISNYDRVEAIDGNSLNKEDFIIDNRFKRKLVANEFACYLSHLKALQSFIKSGAGFAVILEDDVKLAPDFTGPIEKAMNKYTNLNPGERWDMLKLWNKNRRNILITDLDDKYFIGLCGTSIPGGALGTVWTQKGAKKFIQKIFAENKMPTIKRPIDCEYQHAWEYDLTIYNLLPSVIALSDQVSVISETRALKHSNFIAVARYEFGRLIPKYKYYIDKQGLRKFINSFILKKNKLVL